MKILFVCTGNTCRSCMAEAIFNKINNLENVKAFSAGLSVVSGSKASENTVLVLKNTFDVDISDRKAVQISEDIAAEMDLIVTMTKSMKKFLYENLSEYKGRIYSLGEITAEDSDIIDPYGGDVEIYEETFKTLKKYIEVFLDKIKEGNGINN